MSFDSSFSSSFEEESLEDLESFDFDFESLVGLPEGCSHPDYSFPETAFDGTDILPLDGEESESDTGSDSSSEESAYVPDKFGKRDVAGASSSSSLVQKGFSNNKTLIDARWDASILDASLAEFNRYVKQQNLSAEDRKAIKEARRRRKNRVYAVKSREKKIKREDLGQPQILASLQLELHKLKAENSALREENKNLKKSLLSRKQ